MEFITACAHVRTALFIIIESLAKLSPLAGPSDLHILLHCWPLGGLHSLFNSRLFLSFGSVAASAYCLNDLPLIWIIFLWMDIFQLHYLSFLPIEMNKRSVDRNWFGYVCLALAGWVDVVIEFVLFVQEGKKLYCIEFDFMPRLAIISIAWCGHFGMFWDGFGGKLMVFILESGHFLNINILVYLYIGFLLHIRLF